MFINVDGEKLSNTHTTSNFNFVELKLMVGVKIYPNLYTFLSSLLSIVYTDFFEYI